MKKLITLLLLASIGSVYAYTPTKLTEDKITNLINKINFYDEGTREAYIYIFTKIIKGIKKDDIIEGPFELIKVIDGDTIKVNYYGVEENIRIVGINTPESTNKKECYGKEATNEVKALLEGKKVTMQRDNEERDIYGRLIRYVYVDKQDLGILLLKGGYAREYSYEDYNKSGEYKKLEEEAKGKGLGLWGQCE